MEKIQTTDEAVMETLRAVVAERPDYVYDSEAVDENGVPMCVYVADGAPSCLVGHVLHRLGVPLDALSVFDESGGKDAQLVVRRVLDGTSGATAHRLWAAQSAQDNGETWGEALEAAER